MPGAAGVQIPENNLDALHSSSEEDGTSETMDPQDLSGSFLLVDIDLTILGYDPLALVDGFTPVKDNIGLLETRFDEEAIFVFVFPEDMPGSVNLTLLSLFFGVTATNLSLELLMLGQVFRNKLDENSIVSRNKARLVAQGYNQQKGVDYNETYALVARLESIRILLTYACVLDFKLFQMDVKSAFLNGYINEEVYVAQPPGFIDFEKPDHVYKLKKALYGLKQVPKAWYDKLKAFLIKHEYKMGMVDNTLFTKKKSSKLIIIQIYADDIIFGSTCQDRCVEFAKIMHDEFEMSMMGKLNFFLGLQLKQMENGIFFNQSKYIKEMLKKFGLEDSKPMKTRMSSDTKLTKDKECESVDSTKYRGTTHLGLWYPKGTDIETVVYADSNHAEDYGACLFTGKWSLDDLAYGVPRDGPYQTNPLSPNDIISYIRNDQEGQTRKDYGTIRGRHSTSSSSAFVQPSSSHLNDDGDDNDNEDVPPRPSNPQPLQSYPSLDITLSLSPFENLETPSPPSPPQPQPPITGYSLYYNYHDYYGRDLRSGREATEFDQQIKMVHDVKLSNILDSWRWSLEKSECDWDDSLENDDLRYKKFNAYAIELKEILDHRAMLRHHEEYNLALKLEELALTNFGHQIGDLKILKLGSTVVEAG
ncbi:retrovirus-related pol polyprotein from transposon TNT 1-94 [Tanacetum coccineum]|uniref:Retrovirus-related pol polyprotein from transposon TNT 1-94 n=1 Tax=Tanacetum coccineum TaxID=301880 RepID=A0ABQ4WR78_9ASTR